MNYSAYQVVETENGFEGSITQLQKPEMEKTGGMYMCRGHYIPWWRAMPLARLLVKNYYYYGNSPIMAFYPREFAGLPDAFKKEFGYVRWRGITHKWPLDRICKTDERFISYFARGKTRVFSRALASKFTTEYMTVGWDYSAFICRFGFVEMSDGAEAAIEALHEAEVEGRKLVVNESRPRDNG